MLAGTVPVSGLSGSVKGHQAAVLKSHLSRVAETHAALELVPSGTTYTAGEANLKKNRLHAFLPSDMTRIPLIGHDPRAPEAYVNANAIYFPGVHRPLKYLACQGPIPQTIVDMWKMVWQENIELVVNLTCVGEIDSKGRPRSCEYYPGTVGQQVAYGEIAVKLVAMNHSTGAHSIVWTLDVSNGSSASASSSAAGSPRRRIVRVVQAHGDSTTWPDKQAPDPAAFTELMRVVEVQRADCPNPNAPVAAHCSSGYDRTGMFILADILPPGLQISGAPD